MKRYVVDTHSIIWHLTQDRHLSRRVRKILDSADEGYAQVLVPSIALVEAVFLVQRQRVPATALSALFALSESKDASIRVMPLDMTVARTVGDFGPAAIPEMPDRIIAATARALGVPLITADPAIAASSLVDVVW